MIFIIVLIILSFIFPPFWGVLLAYISYLIIFKNTRQKRIFTKKIQLMLINGRDCATFSDIYYESVESYARRNGGEVVDDNAVFYIDILGEEIRVSCYKNDPILGGGTTFYI